MTTQQAPTPFASTFTKYLPLVEKLLLAALAIGAILAVMQVDFRLVQLSLMGLAGIFFLSAYRPLDIPREDDEKSGFAELLGLTILPKVLWMGSAIAAVGVVFYLMNLGNDGFEQMLMIGGLTIASGTIILIALFVSGVKHVNAVFPVLFRAVPLCLTAFYILYK